MSQILTLTDVEDLSLRMEESDEGIASESDENILLTVETTTPPNRDSVSRTNPSAACASYQQSRLVGRKHGVRIYGCDIITTLNSCSPGSNSMNNQAQANFSCTRQNLLNDFSTRGVFVKFFANVRVKQCYTPSYTFDQSAHVVADAFGVNVDDMTETPHLYIFASMPEDYLAYFVQVMVEAHGRVGLFDGIVDTHTLGVHQICTLLDPSSGQSSTRTSSSPSSSRHLRSISSRKLLLE
jgi:hypothetical protein